MDDVNRIAYGPDSGTDCNVTYDEVGAITSMPTPTGMRQFSYLPDGSVRTIEDDHASAHFRYDAFGEVQELDLTTGVPPFIPDTRRDRRYGELIAWRDENAGASTASVLLRKIPGPDGFLATRHGAGGPWVFAFGEARGNRFFTDQNGAFVQDIDYQPFGKATSTGAQPGSQLYSNEQWNDGDALAAFGLSQLGARLYDPAIGRFLSRDPLLIPRTAATTNPYAFANNDPVNFSDPTGLCTPGHEQVDCPKAHDEDQGGSFTFGGASFGEASPGGPIGVPSMGGNSGNSSNGDRGSSGRTNVSGGSSGGSTSASTLGSGAANTLITIDLSSANPSAAHRLSLLPRDGLDPAQFPALACGDDACTAGADYIFAAQAKYPIPQIVAIELIGGALILTGAFVIDATLVPWLAGATATQADKIEVGIAAAEDSIPVVENAAATIEVGVPKLAAGSGGQMLGEALNYLRTVPGSLRVDMFSRLAEQITKATNGQWNATLTNVTNARIFSGEGGEALVFDSMGNMFRGQLNDRAAFLFVEDGIFVNFDALRRL